MEMNPQRESALLKYISAVWGQQVTELLHLRDGNFFLHILNLLDQYSSSKLQSETVNETEKLLHVKRFLQDFYGSQAILDDYLNIEIITDDGPDVTEMQVKIELAKLAVVLLGIGVLDSNGKFFMDAALELPVEVQDGVLAMIQSVVLPDSTEVVLTSRIEDVLLEPKDEIDESPSPQNSRLRAINDDSLNSSLRTPQSHKARDSEFNFCLPLRTNTSVLNCSLQEIASPFKSLDINSPSHSPLVDFVQSPQLIQKAVLKQKDLEIRKLREQLNAEILMKEETQLAVQDSLAESAQKDVDIANLHKRIGELLGMQESHDELQELKLKHSAQEAELYMMKKNFHSIQIQKEVAQKEIMKLLEEMSQFQLTVKAQCNHCSEAGGTILRLERQNQEQMRCYNELEKSHSACQDRIASLQENCEVMTKMRDSLKNELELLQAKLCGAASPKGESMGIVLDIQMGELRCELKMITEERDELLQQLESSKQTIQTLKEQAEHHQQNLKTLKDTNTSLCDALKIERDTNMKMKKRMNCYIAKCEDIGRKFEKSQKDKEISASEIARLNVALQNMEKKLAECQQPIESSHCKFILGNDIENNKTDGTGSCDDSLVMDTFNNTAHHTRLSSGYDSSISPQVTVIEKDIVSFTRDADKNPSDEKDQFVSRITRSLASTSIKSRCSSASLQSIKSVKELFPGVLPNAMSCANEPDYEFEWNKLGQLSLASSMRNMSNSSGNGDSVEKGKLLSRKRKSPKKEEPCDENDKPSPAKQVKEKSGGTVIYFPLNPNGPVYPPPQPPTQPRRTSGRFTPTTQEAPGTSNSTTRSKSMSTTGDSKLTPVSSPKTRTKQTPGRRASQRLRQVHRQKALRTTTYNRKMSENASSPFDFAKNYLSQLHLLDFRW